jgi:polyvinyl alcohol dehydrogenase (cytochrome)
VIGRIFILTFAVAALAAAADPGTGEAQYRQRCAMCHDRGGERIPPKDALNGMTPARILRTLDMGAMMNIAYPMNRSEREAVSAYLGKAAADPAPPPEAFCKDRAIKLNDSSKFVWNGWSPTSDNARYVPTELAGMTLAQVGKLKLKWAFGFEGDVTAFAQPTVFDGHVFVGSAGGAIHALHADTGCIEWVFQANGPVRTAIAVAPLGSQRDSQHALIFSDLTGWVYSLEAETGKLRWKKKVEEHEATRLTGGALVHDGIAYIPAASWEETRALNADYPCCTFRGSITAVRVRDGSVVWKSYMIPAPSKQTGTRADGKPAYGPSGAGVWSTPTLDLKRRLLYVTTGDSYSSPAADTSDSILALDLRTGRIVWARQTTPRDAWTSGCSADSRNASCPQEEGPDYDFGSSAILVKTAQGRDVVLAGQKSGVVYALDPDKKGEIVWQARVGKGGTIGGVQWGMASDGQNLYASVSDAVFTKSLNGLDPNQGGGLTALRIADGSRIWHKDPAPCGARANCSPAQSAALTAIPGVVFSPSMDGHLRAYSTEEGNILWDFDTVRDYKTVNGVTAKGGSMDGPGAVIVNGILFVNSGYSRFGGIRGNVLLAFSLAE